MNDVNDIMDALSPEELAALDDLQMTLHAERDVMYAEGSSDTAQDYPEIQTTSKTRATVNVDELIRQLREETREGSITPDRLAEIFDGIKNGQGAGLTPSDLAEIESAKQQAITAEKTATSAHGTATSAKSTADNALKLAQEVQKGLTDIQGQKFWKGTLSLYDALSKYDDDTVYYIIPDS